MKQKNQTKSPVPPEKPKNKYHNVETVKGGIKFASRLESEYYTNLKLLEKAGIIRDLEMQVPFILMEPFTDRDGKKHRAIKYVADFVYTETESGARVVADCKGMRTRVYEMKRKMFLQKYPELKFREVVRNDVRWR